MAKQTKADRKEAQARLAEERARQAAAARRRTILISVVTVVIIALIGGSVAIAIAKQNKAKSTAGGPTPAAATGSNGGIPTGATVAEAAANKLPTIDIYEDYQCPVCKEFEGLDHTTIQALAAQNKARVVYHSINIIGPNYGGLANTSSLRAASAAACVSNESIEKYLTFHNTAFANQPTEGTGMSDATLIAWGNQAGATSAAFKNCVNGQTYVGWAKRVDAQASDRGVTGTPTLYVDGKELKPADWQSPTALLAAIAANTKK